MYKHCAQTNIIGPYGRIISSGSSPVRCDVLTSHIDIKPGDFVEAVYGAPCWHVDAINRTAYWTVLYVTLVEGYTEDYTGTHDVFSVDDKRPMLYLRPVERNSEKVLDTLAVNQ